MVLAARARALEAARTHEPEVFADLATAFARANNLREIGLGTGYKTAELTAVERDLSDAVEAAEEAVAAALREETGFFVKEDMERIYQEVRVVRLPL